MGGDTPQINEYEEVLDELWDTYLRSRPGSRAALRALARANDRGLALKIVKHRHRQRMLCHASRQEVRKQIRNGVRFGFLLVTDRTRLTRVRCLCDCGKSTVVRGVDLAHGRIRSCGCKRTKRR